MLLANILYEESAGRILWRAMPLLLFVLGVLAIAYRFYSAFLAAKVACLDDKRITPAHEFNDGQNYHPTNRWVLFGHHFAAISGAGPLIGPVLALQYGYAPGLIWLVVGVCLAGAVQDMLVLAASVRRGGKSLAEIARAELGPWASFITSLAILFIVIIALAGLGLVVVKALGGEEVKLPKGMTIILPTAEPRVEFIETDPPVSPFQKTWHQIRSWLGLSAPAKGTEVFIYSSYEPPFPALIHFPPGCAIRYAAASKPISRAEGFTLRATASEFPLKLPRRDREYPVPDGAVQLIPGSSWGLFTIACTIPIALLVSLYMYVFRKGKVVEASIVGAAGVIGATIAGAWIPGSALEPYFSLTQGQTTFALCAYGFIASVLPVWLLLCPRDYISSFLKIGTIALLIVGVLLANPVLRCPAFNEIFMDGGPTFEGSVFPFVFICIMCGAISGFHALVSSGTTPKMIDKESDIRPIGYGAMLMEGLVGVVALIAGASMDPQLYYDINVDLAKADLFQPKLQEMEKKLGLAQPAAKDPLHAAGVDTVQHLNLAQVEEMVGGESLRGRTGGAVTLAVSMALIFTDALRWTALPVAAVMKYWYHFAIMFEALFILTTIDTGTRIARFLLQEMLGRVHPKFGETSWLPGSLLATLLVTLGWGLLVASGSISTIWPMFGIANQLLAALALALVTTVLINRGQARWAFITIIPMLWVCTTTLTAGTEMIGWQFPAKIRLGEQKNNHGLVVTYWLSLVLALTVMTSVMSVVLMAVARWVAVLATGKKPVSSQRPPQS
jgi:carbon starvation protein